MQNVGVIHGKRVRRKKDSSRWIWIAVLVLILGTISITTVFLVSGSITTTSQVPGTEGSEAEGISGPTTAEYPYLAEVPAELEGKVQLVYSFVVNPSELTYSIKTKFTNIADTPIIEYGFETTLKDTQGKVLSRSGGGVAHLIKPGELSLMESQGGVGINLPQSCPPPETWIAELKITSVNFQ